MMKFLKIVFIIVILIAIGWFLLVRFGNRPTSESKHQLLIERIEAMGKLELVKYRFSDVLEHKNVSAYLPDASVLLIVKADAVGCVDLTKLSPQDIEVIDDSVSIRLPAPEICYVKIDHEASKVYDTKMAFFREATLVDEAFKSAEKEVYKEVRNSDILTQTKENAIHVFRPLLEGLGFSKIRVHFE
ncbi:DUF4230 domain-containing protein [Sphingobacterium corticibacterium]|uniref:DUF4230 domain-containing protein n=1 Tax=Sphingobacterium corticibacterium TaxID=2484746 RepID=A0A4Q6XYE7_9SPHI|nr:DUF4230 domain-containing protein [Sphingobacterium corticibacterium]RZF62029.1 DUF4230 domain-containing protein [Sphingobacterium corticibacterium]